MPSHEGVSGFLSQATREEAFALLDGLRSKDAIIWCRAVFFGLDLTFTGKIDVLSPSTVGLVARDGKSWVSFPLDLDGESFWYTEPSAFPFEVRKDLAGDTVFMGILFPLAERGAATLNFPDKILFVELKEQRGEAE
jgi:hypothetical protein